MFRKIKLPLKQPNTVGLAFNVGSALLLACAANILVFVFHLDRGNKDEIRFPIAGYIIGTAWLLLFMLMGLASGS